LAAAIVHVNERLALSDPSLTVAVTLKVPAVVGVPEMSPVLPATVNPGGRPVAV
jgi:hypothetical protein